MTGRPSRRRAGPPPRTPNTVRAKCRRLEALRAWLRGYLHEDFAVEYGDAAGAAEAFCRDATRAEACRLRSDWQAFRALTDGWPLDEIARVLTHDMGGAWIPASLREVAAVGRALDASCPE